MTTATLPASVSQGRWGFYALDAADGRALKAYHKLLLRDRRATKRRARWLAKLEHNRKGPEPACLGTDQRTYAWVLDEYRRLRHPLPSPDLVTPADLPQDWKTRLAELAGFYQVG